MALKSQAPANVAMRNQMQSVRSQLHLANKRKRMLPKRRESKPFPWQASQPHGSIP
jgi:hypothetical protein